MSGDLVTPNAKKTPMRLALQIVISRIIVVYTIANAVI